MPYNWGFKGLSSAASTNLLTIDAGDPNTWIQETKACLVNVVKAGAINVSFTSSLSHGTFLVYAPEHQCSETADVQRT